MGADPKIPKVKICLIEDDPLISEMYQAKFHQQDFEIHSAPDGKDGFNLLKKIQPDIALIDIMMPNMDGLQLMKKIQKDPTLSNLPIIVLTNLDDEKTAAKTANFNVRFYLVKSQYSPAEVVGVVKEVLKLP